MHSLKIEPSQLAGEIRVPPSKSISHRALICAGLAEGKSRIENVVFSEDIEATLEGLRALGVSVQIAEKEQEEKEPKEKEEEGKAKTLLIRGNPGLAVVKHTIDCRESGSTLRFLIPLATLSGGEVTFKGQGKLVERPLEAYYDIFEEQRIEYRTDRGFLPLTVKGSIKPGTFPLKGNVSSQFISGLLFLLPALPGDSRIIVTTELESRGYVDLTIDVLNRFGIEVENRGYREFRVKGSQKYQSCAYRVEGDYSQAAFWVVAGILGGRINCLDLNPGSLQGDRVILDIVREMGAPVGLKGNGLEVKASPTRGTVIDAGQCPDLVPVLAVLGALSQGTTRIINAGRLRIKESDRLKAIAAELNKLGAKVKELEEGLLIEGVQDLRGGTVDSWNDHRIAMALAVASLRCTEPVHLTGFEAVRKSYPHFWQDFKRLGGKCDEWNLG